MYTIHSVGDRIAGRYEVFAIHRGGMGIVYEVEDHSSGFGCLYLALKTVGRELLNDPHRSARFYNECKIWIQMGKHPNIVQAFAIEELEGTPHIVLERLECGDLSKSVGAIDIPIILKLGIEFCLGMEHAIRQGLRCHRDIKPGNLMMTEDGAIKITDFGIAGIRDEIGSWSKDDLNRPIEIDSTGPENRIIWDDPRDKTADNSLHEHKTVFKGPLPVLSERKSMDSTIDSAATSDFVPPDPLKPVDSQTSLTRTGAMLGTLPYMAPEQFSDAHHADIRADIYAFGIVLYQLLTGELPFRGNSVAMFERQHSQYAVPSVRSAIPREFARVAEPIDQVVHRCLGKKPSDRFENIEELRREMYVIWRRVQRKSWLSW